MGNLVELQVLSLDVEDMVSPYPEVLSSLVFPRTNVQVLTPSSYLEICDRGPKLIVTYLSAVRAANVSKTVDLRGLALTSFPVLEYLSLGAKTRYFLHVNHLQTRASLSLKTSTGNGTSFPVLW